MKVWWLTSDAIRALQGGESSFPTYIAEMIRSRTGRSGRGRLWTAPGIEGEVAEVHFDELVGDWIMLENMGGIVVKDEDAAALVNLPGFLTDLELKRWPAVPGPDQVT